MAVSSVATAYGALPAPAPHRSTLRTPSRQSNAPVPCARLCSRRSRPECYADFPTRDYIPYIPIVIPDLPGCDRGQEEGGREEGKGAEVLPGRGEKIPGHVRWQHRGGGGEGSRLAQGNNDNNTRRACQEVEALVFAVKALVVRGIEGAEEGPGKSEEEMEGGRNLTGESGKTGIPEGSCRGMIPGAADATPRVAIVVISVASRVCGTWHMAALGAFVDRQSHTSASGGPLL